MIMPFVHNHIGPLRHVTGDAFCRAQACFVKMMVYRIVSLFRMASKTHGITVRAQCRAMWIMAIRALNTFMKHSALDKRTVFIVLALDLPIGEIGVRLQKRYPVVVLRRLSMNIVFVDLFAT
jgi:hypothetical protein